MDHTESYTGPERRRFSRIPFSFPIRFKECGYNKDDLKEEGMSQYAYSNNISVGGVQLKLPIRLKLGKYLKMKLTLPIYSECKVMHFLGQVMWTQVDEAENQYVAGIQFLDLDEIEKITLEEFINESVKDT